MAPDLLARSLQEFLSETRNGVVFEDGQVLFDLASAQYSVTAEKDRCLLHLWSQERNLVRNVLEAESKNGVLTLTVRRYARRLERALRREMPGWTLEKARLSTSMDLERSFSPVYARGLLRKGRSGFAVLGVNSDETQAAIDASLTFGLLWLQACREREAEHCLVEGLRLYLPPRTSATVQIRMAHLNHSAAEVSAF